MPVACWAHWNDAITVLHSKYKLEYFKKQGWGDEVVKTLQKVMFDKFDHAYAHLPAENETSKGSQDDEEVDFPSLYNINYKFMANFSRLLASLTICLIMIHLWNWVLQSSEMSSSSILTRKWIWRQRRWMFCCGGRPISVSSPVSTEWPWIFIQFRVSLFYNCLEIYWLWQGNSYIGWCWTCV